MKRILPCLGLLVVTVLACGCWSAWADEPVVKSRERPADIHTFMRLKLSHSQQVLEGIVLEDFGVIAKHAAALSTLVEDEKWMIFQTPEYRAHSAAFNEICRDLTKAAERRNVDAATLAYVQLTMSCVTCHKYTRGIRMAALPAVGAPPVR